MFLPNSLNKPGKRALMNNPSHYAEINELDALVEAKTENVVLASSDKALELKEHYKDKEYPAVIYFPRDSVQMGLLKKVEGFNTSCPIKGLATYYDYLVDGADGQIVEKAAWSYEEPLSDFSQIRNYISFDKSRLDVKISIQ